jgi:ubiquinone/menaquinone biosynthesis C-methylase UbiE
MKVLKRDFEPEIVKKNFAKVLWIYDIWGWLSESKAAGRVIELCDIKDGINILEVAVGTANSGYTEQSYPVMSEQSVFN